MNNKKLIEEEMTPKAKSKDVGTCLRYKGKQQIFRSKFKNPKDAQEQLDTLKNIGVVTDSAYEVYRCPECHQWHFGLKEWSK